MYSFEINSKIKILPPQAKENWAIISTCLGVGLTAFFLAWLGSQLLGFPQPIYHDEFSYLLGAETFASGNLMEKTHPMGFFFETYHQLQTPSYASKYPPAQGLFLALGILFGEPIYGVWLCQAMLASASVWMARAYMPLRWAGAVGAFVAIWFGFICYWVQSYWGGTIAAIGSVLIWGAVRRLHVRVKYGPSIMLGLGAALLLLSRPFEGLLACVVPGILIIRRLIRSKEQGTIITDSVKLAALLAPLTLAIAFQAILNKAVTGNALRFPYSEYNRQYDANPILFWQTPGEPIVFHHERMENFDYKVAAQLTRFPTPALPLVAERISNYVIFYTGGSLILAMLLYFVRPSRWAFWFLAATGVSLTSTILVYYYYPHYLAPALAPGILLMAWTFRNAALAIQGEIKTKHLLIALALIGTMMCLRGTGLTPLSEVKEHARHRQAIEQRLSQDPQNHLVLVHYDPYVNPHIEYVFNSAQIDLQKIIWARWHPTAGPRGLFEYYKGRKLWMLRVVRKGEPILSEFKWVPGSAY